MGGKRRSNGRREVEGEGRLLVERQRGPASSAGGAETFPAQRAQVRRLDAQQHPQPPGAPRGDEGVPDGPGEDGPTEDLAVRQRVERQGQQVTGIQAYHALHPHR